MAHEAMPDDARKVYIEAQEVAAASPRAAVGLQRLALQLLVDDLVEGNANLNTKIGELVKRGLDPQVQVAMDTLRVIGNNAVHPGQIEVEEDPALVESLFALLNLVVEQVIARAEMLQSLYGKLPTGALDAIAHRDTPKA